MGDNLHDVENIMTGWGIQVIMSAHSKVVVNMLLKWNKNILQAPPVLKEGVMKSY